MRVAFARLLTFLYPQVRGPFDDVESLEQAQSVLLEPDLRDLVALDPVDTDTGPLDRVAGRFDPLVLPVCVPVTEYRTTPRPSSHLVSASLENIFKI